MEISKRVSEIMQEIEEICLAANRNPKEVKLVAVTKYAESEMIENAISAGIRIIGENRVQEAVDKHRSVPSIDKVEKHFIGSLQSNKTKLAVQYFDCIQSIDSEKLAYSLNEEAEILDKLMPVFIEVNVGKEQSKHGIFPENIVEFCNYLTKFTSIKPSGLMCIAPFFEENEIEKTRPYFQLMKELHGRTGLKELSMGMSNDYKIAIEEGSTMVRIGRKIFS